MTSDQPGSGSSSRSRQGRVAAACYRQTARGIEFLLVRTTGGCHWTFPKGHVKRGEHPLDAAAREAREEAGVTGRLDPESVGGYLYPGGSGPKEERKDPVVAYLLEVVTEDPPEEVKREPTWFTPAEAMRRLAEDREEKYVREHDRILDAALERLGSLGGNGAPP